MKAISLWQPWASLWLSDAKVHETRAWSTPVRGTIAVHAAKKVLRLDELSQDLLDVIHVTFGGSFQPPRGAIIGTVDIVDCYPTMRSRLHEAERLDRAWSPSDRICGNWEPGRFAFKRNRFRRFDRPIPYVGRQGWFNVPDELVRSAA